MKNYETNKINSMKTEIKKSTLEEIKEMRELYKNGMTLTKIGRRFGKDHSTVWYWIRRDKNYIKNKVSEYEHIGGETKEFIREIKKRKQIEETQKINPNLCLQCKKKKRNKKWHLTNFCSMKCWIEYHYPSQHVNLFTLNSGA